MGPFGLKIVAQPASEPVTVAEAKARLRITIDDEDSDLAALITQARELCEAACGRAFVTQSLLFTADDFPRGVVDAIRLPRAPLQSVTSIKYYDLTGTQQTLDPSLYFVDANGEPGRVCHLFGSYWPYIQYGRPAGLEVRYVAGYGAASAVPNAAKAAILLTVKQLRDDPGADLPPAARRFLDTLETGEIR